MAEISKEQLILECTKIMTPLVYSGIKESFNPESKVFIQMCVAAGYKMADEILCAAKALEKKNLKNTQTTEQNPN